ncbi:MAG: hypothetical protein IKP26_05705 [Clostridia bacterium]|nr:hypothetical protein [Clostridia bacterium]
MKRILALTLCILTLFFCACQPTPDVEPVPNKGDDEAGEKIRATAVPTADPEASETAEAIVPPVFPTHWDSEVKTETGRMLINADIITSDQSTYPVYTVRRHEVTTEDLQPIADYFFPSITAVRNGDKPGKEDIEAAIADLLASEKTEEHKAKYLEYLKGEYNSATVSDDDFIPADRLDMSDLSSKTVLLSDGSRGVYSHVQNINWPIIFRSHIDTIAQDKYTAADNDLMDLYGDDDDYDLPSPEEMMNYIDPEITLDEATANAEEFFGKVGIDGCGLAESVEGRLRHSSSHVTLSTGWILTYVRSYSYVPASPATDDTSGRGLFAGDDDMTQYAKGMQYEWFELYVSGSGLEYFSWMNPMEVEGPVNENVQLMDFDELTGNLERLLKAYLSYPEKFYRWFRLEKMVLTVAPQQQKDSDDFYLMPVWVCYFHSFNWETPDDYVSKDYGELPTTFAINAIDGTRVDLGVHSSHR